MDGDAHVGDRRLDRLRIRTRRATSDFSSYCVNSSNFVSEFCIDYTISSSCAGNLGAIATSGTDRATTTHEYANNIDSTKPCTHIVPNAHDINSSEHCTYSNAHANGFTQAIILADR
jgi:hypothetical protein